MDNMLRYIPGFRSNTTWKKIIAIIYYIFALLMFAGGWGLGLMFLTAPFMLFSFIDVIKNKNSKPIQPIIAFIISFILLITSINGINTSAAEQARIEKQQQIKAEEQAALEASQKAEEEHKQKEEEKRKKEEENKKAEEEAKRKADEEEKKKQEEAAKVNTKIEGQLKVHYIDVGQGDCALIHVNDAAMLIDAGDRGYGSGIVNYIKAQGIKKLDYVIFTHPHADHTGGGADVINAFDIGQIIMPKVSHTSKTFENLLITIKNKGMKINTPKPGEEYSLGNAKFTILGPNSASYHNLNNYSVVNKVIFGNTSFLFAGDAEGISENEILSKGFDIKADVLKVGHHGSDTSTGEQFLKAVGPKHAIISCGKGNKYGHPTQAVLARLAAHKVELYRTDESGTIIATSDGKTITFDKKASPIKQNAPPKQETKAEPKKESRAETKTAEQPKQEQAAEQSKQKAKPTPTPKTDNVEEVYITNSGKKYHRNGCQYLSKSQIPISLEKAKKDGYEPCSKCHPPQ
jgi:competence protein ComEC